MCSAEILTIHHEQMGMQVKSSSLQTVKTFSGKVSAASRSSVFKHVAETLAPRTQHGSCHRLSAAANCESHI